MMMEMIEEAWDYIFGSLTPLLWINLFALSLSYWRDNNKDMDAPCTMKGMQNPNTTDATMQRED
jgi:hypothetical protein